MPKSVKRISFTRTVTYTYTADMPSYAAESDAIALDAANLPGGINAIGQLLAGAVSANGSITILPWDVASPSTRVEPYGVFVPSLQYQIGARVAPSAANSALMHVVTQAGVSGTTEPTWAVAEGGLNSSGGVSFVAVSKFTPPATFPLSTPLTVGALYKPSVNSTKEYVVTQAGTSASSAPTWTSFDTVGSVVTSGGAQLLCIAGVSLHTASTFYAFGQVIKSSGASTQEWLVTVPGRTGASLPTLAGAIGTIATSGGITVERIA